MMSVDFHPMTEEPKEGQICIVRDLTGTVQLAKFGYRSSGVSFESGFFKWSPPDALPIPYVIGWIEYDFDQSARP